MTLFTWIDAAYAVHGNMRSLTGGVISMRLGILHAKSSKQKLNTKSSTEAEVVGVSNYLPFNLHFVIFLREQGYTIKENILYQDNESAIRMETNGRMSCTSNPKHIDIRYFFVKDRVDKKEIEIHHCPTAKMVAAYFTKPFRKLRRIPHLRTRTMYPHPRSVLWNYRMTNPWRTEKLWNYRMTNP